MSACHKIMATKNVDRRIIESVQILSYCVDQASGAPLDKLPINSNGAMHIIRAESLAKYVPYDVQVKTSFSKITVRLANGSLSFSHVTANPNTTWQADLKQVLPSDGDGANVQCRGATRGMSVEIESLPGEIQVKRTNATRWKVNNVALAIRIMVM